MATRPKTNSPALPTLSATRTPALRVLLLVAALPVLSACIPLVLTAVTVSAVDISLDRRTAGVYLNDNVLEAQLRSKISADETLGEAVNVSVTAFNGIVLLSGEVNSDAQRQRVGEIAQDYAKTGKTRKVVNELELAGKTTFVSRINDSLITTTVKTNLFNTKNLSATDIKVVTEHGKVYLLGLVTQVEADAAVAAVRAVRGVTHIVKVFEYIEPE